jgi:hypothetical protein
MEFGRSVLCCICLFMAGRRGCAIHDLALSLQTDVQSRAPGLCASTVLLEMFGDSNVGGTSNSTSQRFRQILNWRREPGPFEAVIQFGGHTPKTTQNAHAPQPARHSAHTACTASWLAGCVSERERENPRLSGWLCVSACGARKQRDTQPLWHAATPRCGCACAAQRCWHGRMSYGRNLTLARRLATCSKGKKILGCHMVTVIGCLVDHRSSSVAAPHGSNASRQLARCEQNMTHVSNASRRRARCAAMVRRTTLRS